MALRTLVLMLPLLVAGCPGTSGDDNASTGSDEAGSSTAGGPCQPGSVDACLCPDGSPALQTCLADGSGFGACECGGGTTGPSTSASTSASSGASVSASASASDSLSASASDTAESSGGDADASGSSGGGGEQTSSEGPAPECDGSHPIVEGDMRFCDAGDCYCGDFSVMPPFDVCYAEEIAQPCCPVEVVCY